MSLAWCQPLASREKDTNFVQSACVKEGGSLGVQSLAPLIAAFEFVDLEPKELLRDTSISMSYLSRALVALLRISSLCLSATCHGCFIVTVVSTLPRIEQARPLTG